MFNESAYLDEFEVVLSDGTRVLYLMILDAVCSFRVVVPTDMKRSISGERMRGLFESNWGIGPDHPTRCTTTQKRGT